jgi:dihydroorotase
LYAEVFEAASALHRFEDFTSRNGARFYGLAENTGTITLARQQWEIPASLPFAEGEIVPLRAGETCLWKLVDRHD